MITNCILRNGGEEIEADPEDLTVTYCNVEHGYEGVGNYDAEPGFALARDYHVMRGSYEIDAGDVAPPKIPGGWNRPAVDADGLVRVVDGDGDGEAVVDIGPYEYVPGEARLAVSSPLFQHSLSEGDPQVLVLALQIRNAGDGSLPWTVTGDHEAVSFNFSEGESGGEIDVVEAYIDTSLLSIGMNALRMEVGAPEAVNGTREVLAHVEVRPTLRVPSNYPSIVEAVIAAVDGDVVEVADGEYVEGFSIRDARVTVRSEHGPEHCCLRGGSIYMLTAAASGSVIDGFTLMGPVVDQFLYVGNSCADVTLRNIVVDGDGQTLPQSIMFFSQPGLFTNKLPPA